MQTIWRWLKDNWRWIIFPVGLITLLYSARRCSPRPSTPVPLTTSTIADLEEHRKDREAAKVRADKRQGLAKEEIAKEVESDQKDDLESIIDKFNRL